MEFCHRIHLQFPFLTNKEDHLNINVTILYILEARIKMYYINPPELQVTIVHKSRLNV